MNEKWTLPYLRSSLKRGEDKAYVITPIGMEELYFTPEMENL